MILATLATVAMAAGAVGEPNVQNPDWISAPSGQAIADQYPGAAEMLRITGEVTLDCTLTIESRVKDCKVIKESPAGWGFGEAALRLTSLFKLRPQLVDGAPTEGQVKIPIRFQPPTPSDMEAIRREIRPRILVEPDERRKALAKRVLAARGPELRLEDLTNALMHPLSKPPSAEGLPRYEAIFQLVPKAVEAEWPRIRDERVRSYAAAFSAEELEQIAAFYESPAGKAWVAHERLAIDLFNSEFGEAQERIGAAVRSAYCAANPCPK